MAPESGSWLATGFAGDDVPRRFVDSGLAAVAKLRRLADALESGSSFRIQVAGERFRVPAQAVFSVEHERGDDGEEVEFQLKWSLADRVDDADTETVV